MGHRVRSSRVATGTASLQVCNLSNTYLVTWNQWLLDDLTSKMYFVHAVNIHDGHDDFNRCTSDVKLDCSIDPKYRTSPRLPVSVLVRSPQKGQEMAGWCPPIPHVQQTCDGLRCATKLHW